MLSDNVVKSIQDHALSEYPKECCGLVIRVDGIEQYVRCKNIAEKGGVDSFKIGAQERSIVEDMGEVIALAHSHPDWVNKPSPADVAACEESEIPWVIVSVNDGIVSEPNYLLPTGNGIPLLGRDFYHGVLDCYALIRDYYKRELSIVLPDFEREDDWWKKGKNLYIENFEKAGFRRLSEKEEIAESDVILMTIRSEVANHAGIYLGTRSLKENLRAFKVPNAMLHHLYGRLSERTVYGGYWADITVAILRHKCLEQ